ncbi:hypothetical protein [Pseudomonas sp. C5pp]|uniref:hypothetical protein n=1 Tax=Pseudomonas sp. C5pp TaxID=1586081 RepID=UPI00057D820B|nr:hypothetical protein [Pseudomonas sp. C5pp]KIC79345.1 hypothetical protein RR51_27265 [Pseudomonas sp. C5pp]
MDTNKMREMREAFERTNSRDHRRQPPKGNNYIDPMAQADWESFQKGWQASREAVVVELPSACAYEGLTEHLGSLIELSYEAPEHDPVGLARLPDVREAIEAHGLKVAP